MSEMVERVARAMWAQSTPFDWEKVQPRTQEETRSLARIAIAAMREPTFEMVAAIPKACSFPYKHECGKNAWLAMIDEALKP